MRFSGLCKCGGTASRALPFLLLLYSKSRTILVKLEACLEPDSRRKSLPSSCLRLAQANNKKQFFFAMGCHRFPGNRRSSSICRARAIGCFIRDGGAPGRVGDNFWNALRTLIFSISSTSYQRESRSWRLAGPLLVRPIRSSLSVEVSVALLPFFARWIDGSQK